MAGPRDFAGPPRRFCKCYLEYKLISAIEVPSKTSNSHQERHFITFSVRRSLGEGGITSSVHHHHNLFISK